MTNAHSFGNDLLLSAEELKNNNYLEDANPDLKYIFQRNAIHNLYYGSFHIAGDFAKRISTLLALPSIEDTSANAHTGLITFYVNTSEKINKTIPEREHFRTISKNLDTLRKKRNTADYDSKGFSKIDPEVKLCFKISQDVKKDIEKLHVWLDDLESQNR